MKYRSVIIAAACFVGVASAAWIAASHSADLEPAPKLSHEAFEAEADRLTQKLEQTGIVASFAYAREQLAVNPSFARDCHPLMHRLGRASFARYQSFQSAIESADELCNSGYVHGLIEANLSSASSVDNALATSCPAQLEQNFKQWQCFHGLGHGLMYVYQKDHVKSIARCQKLPGEFASSSCINGVFMEKFIVVNHGGGHTATTPRVDLSVCKSLESKLKGDCYIYAPTAYLEEHPNRYNEAIKWCEQSDNNWFGSCVSGVGSEAMKSNITNPAYAARFCGQVEARLRISCVYGAVSLFINHNGSTDPARALCDKEFKLFNQTCKAFVKNRAELLKI